MRYESYIIANDSEYQRQLGQQIRYKLDSIGMTQASLAKDVGCTQAAMSRYVNGARYPSVFILRRIASVLNISIDELLGVHPNDNNQNTHSFPKNARVCPRCGHINGKVYESRTIRDCLIRRRQCPKCYERWKTIEITEKIM